MLFDGGIQGGMFLVFLARLHFNDSNLVLFLNDEIEFLLAVLVIVVQGDSLGRQGTSHIILRQRTQREAQMPTC